MKPWDEMVAPEMASISQGLAFVPCFTVRISPLTSALGALAAMRFSQSGRPRFAG